LKSKEEDSPDLANEKWRSTRLEGAKSKYKAPKVIKNVNDKKDDKPQVNVEEVWKERKREAKARLKENGFNDEICERYSELMSKDKLTIEEKFEEAAITEILNKNLNHLQELEIEKSREIVKPSIGPTIKYIQDIRNGFFSSKLVL